MRVLLFLFILLFASSFAGAFAQTVRSETLTEKEKRYNYIFFEEISPRQKQITEIIKKMDLPSIGLRGYDLMDMANLQQQQKLNETVLNRISLNGEVFTLCEQVNDLGKQIDKNLNPCLSLKNIKKRAEKNLKNIEVRRKELNGIEEKESNAQSQFDKEIVQLDLDLSSSQSKGDLLDQQLQQLNTKDQSINDFLATKSKAKNELDDFLAAGSASNQSNLGEASSVDFLALAVDEKNYSIESKEGKYRVVDAKGRVLIPYINKPIIDYQGGIAKVRENLDSFLCEVSCYAVYSAQIIRNSFYDNKGKQIDESWLTYAESSRRDGCLTLVRNDDDRSSEEIARSKARRKKRDELEGQDCKNNRKNWIVQKMQEYK